jgi:cytochrome c oxidase accessory protein FixG
VAGIPARRRRAGEEKTDMAISKPKAGSSEGTGLYAAHAKIYPSSVSGTFRRIKWGLLIVLLGIYYLAPFIRWDRGIGQPSQAILIDFTERRFYFFFIEIWPQEVYYLTGLMVLAALVLFLMNAVAGRIWCGYLCPQTVWTDLFMMVERAFEGDRRDRMALDAQPWSVNKLARKAAKHFVWLMIAWWTGGAWVLYFADAPTLVWQLLTFTAPAAAYIWIGILTGTTYLLAGHAREQVCIYMCPWPRIQAAMTDEWALNVTYRGDRGEPRASLKHAEKLREAGEPAGDCVDCQQCVHVCPTGTDIRLGSQLSCIQCGLCIDACDTVMDKVNRPRGLIAYDTDINAERRKSGMAPVFKPIRLRTSLYAGVIVIAAALMLATLLNRATIGLNVLHDRNPIFVQNSDGAIRNGYTVRLLNKKAELRRFTLAVEGLPAGTRIDVSGVATHPGDMPIIEVDPDDTREVRVNLIQPAPEPLPASTSIAFRITEMASGETTVTKDFFKAP